MTFLTAVILLFQYAPADCDRQLQSQAGECATYMDYIGKAGTAV